MLFIVRVNVPHTLASLENGPFTEELNKFIEGVQCHFHLPSVSIGIVDGDQTYLKVKKIQALKNCR